MIPRGQELPTEIVPADEHWLLAGGAECRLKSAVRSFTGAYGQDIPLLHFESSLNNSTSGLADGEVSMQSACVLDLSPIEYPVSCNSINALIQVH